METEISPEGLVCGAARRNLGYKVSEEPEMLAGEYFSTERIRMWKLLPASRRQLHNA